MPFSWLLRTIFFLKGGEGLTTLTLSTILPLTRMEMRERKEPAPSQPSKLSLVSFSACSLPLADTKKRGGGPFRDEGQLSASFYSFLPQPSPPPSPTTKGEENEGGISAQTPRHASTQPTFHGKKSTRTISRDSISRKISANHQFFFSTIWEPNIPTCGHAVKRGGGGSSGPFLPNCPDYLSSSCFRIKSLSYVNFFSSSHSAKVYRH